ncbi:l-2-amino-thiazoline-4-carboxylic acid hydrolase [Firmicutes bacterium CAG:449]|nr:l-2-amino-thiazoline-4-carboxylic acid hydrolase [Firmicutes bacterium CAG:449]
MKYDIICKLMWLMFKNSFSSTLKNDLKIDNYKKIMKKGKKKYKEILKTIPDFDKDDRFKINIISCAQISSVLLSCDKKLS